MESENVVPYGGANGVPAVRDETGVERARKEIEGQIIVAKQFPRAEAEVFSRIQVSCERPAFAEVAYYRFPRGGAQVQGASVNLARELARLWGNVRYGVDIVKDSPDDRIIRAWAWDMETNTYSSEEDSFAKLIFRKGKGWLKPDERDLRELTNRRGAICVRNCILRLMPRDIVDAALEKCFGTIAGSVGTGAKRRETINKLLASFAEFGVVSKDILERYEIEKLDELSVEQIADLRGIYKSMRDGISQKGEHFGAAEKSKAEEASEEKTGDLDLGLGGEGEEMADPDLEALRQIANSEEITADMIDDALAILETKTGSKASAKVVEDIGLGELKRAANRIVALYASRMSKAAGRGEAEEEEAKE